MWGIALTLVQDLALDLVELHEVHMRPRLKPVNLPLHGILQCVGKLESALNPTVHVTENDVKQCCS